MLNISHIQVLVSSLISQENLFWIITSQKVNKPVERFWQNMHQSSWSLQPNRNQGINIAQTKTENAIEYKVKPMSQFRTMHGFSWRWPIKLNHVYNTLHEQNSSSTCASFDIQNNTGEQKILLRYFFFFPEQKKNLLLILNFRSLCLLDVWINFQKSSLRHCPLQLAGANNPSRSILVAHILFLMASDRCTRSEKSNNYAYWKQSFKRRYIKS